MTDSTVEGKDIKWKPRDNYALLLFIIYHRAKSGEPILRNQQCWSFSAPSLLWKLWSSSSERAFRNLHEASRTMASSKAATYYTDVCDSHWLLVCLFPLQESLVLLQKVPKVELDCSQTVLFEHLPLIIAGFFIVFKCSDDVFYVNVS